jgi:alpha-glucosidase
MMSWKWWQTGTIYEVYTRSFQDGNNDGTGDLKGIRNRLDYFVWLGIKAIWLSPVYPSPMADFGYDIADYVNIDPLFGNLSDFDELVRDIHSREMKILMDFVPNHSSDQHPWFIESRSSRDNPKRNWYMWHDALKGGGPPNNWLAMFGGSAWEWDEKTGQYYYHAFLKEQPDLNWRNPEVREAMYDTMRFWLDRGIDGFRIDAIWHLIKDHELRNNPVNPSYNENMSDYDRLLPVYSTDRPEVHDIVKEMRSVHDSYSDHIMIGEAYVSIDKLVKYYGENDDECHLPANFLLILLPWDPIKISESIGEYEKCLPHGAWPNWVIGNHDQPRIASRTSIQQARIAAMLLLTLRGTPTLYYGDEIGMTNVEIPPDEIQDPQGKNMPHKNLGRDPFRNPMRWDSSEYAAFSRMKPWLRMDSGTEIINVEKQKRDPDSILSFYRRLIHFRQDEECLLTGEYELISADSQVLSYLRKLADNLLLVILNFSKEPVLYKTLKLHLKGRIEVATSKGSEGVSIRNYYKLKANEGVIVRLTKI